MVAFAETSRSLKLPVRIRDFSRAQGWQSQRNATRPSRDTLGFDACLVALHNTFATFAMRPRITPHSSRVAEPDDQPPRHGLRKRTAHQMASDDKSHEDASRHQSPPKRLKRTPTLIRTQCIDLHSTCMMCLSVRAPLCYDMTTQVEGILPMKEATSKF